MKKVFASDFDGTLYFYKAEDDRKLPAENVAKIREYQKAGHLFGLCTGRQVGGLTPFITGFVEPDFYITSSGANIVDKDLREIRKRGVDPVVAQTDSRSMWKATSAYSHPWTIRASTMWSRTSPTAPGD